MNDNIVRLRRFLDNYNAIVVIGGQFGDEGKGKIVDLLMSVSDGAVRYGGGCNAGHTILTESGQKFVTHLLPASVLWGKAGYCARGMFMDFAQLNIELQELRAAGIDKVHYLIDRGCPVFLPWHRVQEQWLEEIKGSHKTGTTGKGMVGYALMEDMRMSVRAGDMLRSEDELYGLLYPLYRAIEPIADRMKGIGINVDFPNALAVAEQLKVLSKPHLDYIGDVAYDLWQGMRFGPDLEPEPRIIFEGAQAAGLDRRWGTVPFTSPGLSMASGAAEGCGLPMSTFDKVIMVAKVFPTRVGNGPFVSEMWDRTSAEAFAKRHPEYFEEGQERTHFLEGALAGLKHHYMKTEFCNLGAMSQYLQVLGYERGATTGRGRSVGALDLQWLRHMARLNGANNIALTRLDMVSGMKAVPVVVKYKFDGTVLPPYAICDERDLNKLEPIVEWFPGWQEDISEARSFSDLPYAAQRFINRVQEQLGIHVDIIGVGPRRDQVIVR